MDTLTDDRETMDNMEPSRKSTEYEDPTTEAKPSPRPLKHCRSVPEFETNVLPKKLKRQTTDVEKRFVQFKELTPVLEDNSIDI